MANEWVNPSALTDEEDSKTIMNYEFDKMQVRVVKDENGEPWFVAKDVCDVLGFESPWMAYTRLEADEKANLSRAEVGIQHAGRPIVIISESGLYKLILRSDKPQAKDFQRWVTHEVLPSIRKTGGYIMGEEKMDEDQLVLAAMQVLQRKWSFSRPGMRSWNPRARALTS